MIKNIQKRKLFLLVVDMVIILLSINLASIIRLKQSMITQLGLSRALLVAVLMLTICLLSFYISDLYNIRKKFISSRMLANLASSLVLISLISISLFYLFPYLIGRGIFLISLIMIGIFVGLWRLTYSFFFKIVFQKRNVLIVGLNDSARAMYSQLKENQEYKVIGFIDKKKQPEQNPGIRILGDIRLLEKIAADHKLDDIILSIEPGEDKALTKSLVNCKMKGINIADLPSFYEKLIEKLPILDIKDGWFLQCTGFDKLGSKIYKKTKRFLDLTISFLMLAITLPLIIIISLLIKVTSKGPIFLKQERMGENKKYFKMIKFRTMIQDAEEEGPKWAEENDSRVTKVGKILRKSRLDELPQLINVIKGEMSLIGPRPEREHFVNKLMEMIPYYSLRFAVKPGLTGWAQVNYRYGSSVDDAIEKLRYELYYIKNQSLFLDLRILLKTFRIVLFGLGR